MDGDAGKSATDSLDFLRRLERACERLVSKDIALLLVESHWGTFGSWVIEGSNGNDEDRAGAAIIAGDYDEKGPVSVRVTWDGRDQVLLAQLWHKPTVIEGGGRPDSLGPPRKFVSSAEALLAAEGILVEQLVPGA